VRTAKYDLAKWRDVFSRRICTVVHTSCVAEQYDLATLAPSAKQYDRNHRLRLHHYRRSFCLLSKGGGVASIGDVFSKNKERKLDSTTFFRSHAMAKRRKNRTHNKGSVDAKTSNGTPGAPKSFVIKHGQVGHSIAQLVRDMRKVMEPNTASRLKVL
jgi:hypothetical protein